MKRFLAVLGIILVSPAIVGFGSAEPDDREKVPATVPKREKPRSAQPTPKPAPAKSAKPKAGNPKLPALLAEVEKKYEDAKTLLADFEQTNRVAALGRTEKSSGNIAVKRPGKVRWQTLAPDPNLFVSDGKTYWFYTPPFDEEEPGQVIIRRSNEVQSELANALLSGSFSKASGMTIQEKSPSQFILHPKKGSAGTVKEAEIHVDPKEKVIERVILVHEGGNRSDIRLSQIRLGKELADDLFHFTPPPNTERVEP